MKIEKPDDIRGIVGFRVDDIRIIPPATVQLRLSSLTTEMDELLTIAPQCKPILNGNLLGIDFGVHCQFDSIPKGPRQ